VDSLNTSLDHWRLLERAFVASEDAILKNFSKAVGISRPTLARGSSAD
jgi:hypothetical protein